MDTGKCFLGRVVKYLEMWWSVAALTSLWDLINRLRIGPYVLLNILSAPYFCPAVFHFHALQRCRALKSRKIRC